MHWAARQWGCPWWEELLSLAVRPPSPRVQTAGSRSSSLALRALGKVARRQITQSWTCRSPALSQSGIAACESAHTIGIIHAYKHWEGRGTEPFRNLVSAGETFEEQGNLAGVRAAALNTQAPLYPPLNSDLLVFVFPFGNCGQQFHTFEGGCEDLTTKHTCVYRAVSLGPSSSPTHGSGHRSPR